MPVLETDGLDTHYELVGSGPPILMFSPGGFDSSLDSWRTVGIYKRLDLVNQLSAQFTCVLFDRRESGTSGGRVERVSWASYVRQAQGLLDHLGIERAHLMGGCVGCSSVAMLALADPSRVAGMVLFSPAGGPKYRMKQHERFAVHIAFVLEHGLQAVVDLALEHDRGFSVDPRVGPWVTVLRTNASFRAEYAKGSVTDYVTTVTGLARVMFDRDTVPGPEPEDLLLLRVPALIIPGDDDSHALSAARYLMECLPAAEYWDVPVADQTSVTAPQRILEFLASRQYRV